MNLPMCVAASDIAVPFNCCLSTVRVTCSDILRFYWVVTQGPAAVQFWCPTLQDIRFPVEWKFSFVMAICVVLAVRFLVQFVVASILPYTIRAYVWIFNKNWFCCCTIEVLDEEGIEECTMLFHQMVHFW